MKKGHRVSLTHFLYSLSSDVSFQSLFGKLILITAHLADNFTSTIFINHGLQVVQFDFRKLHPVPCAEMQDRRSCHF